MRLSRSSTAERPSFTISWCSCGSRATFIDMVEVWAAADDEAACIETLVSCSCSDATDCAIGQMTDGTAKWQAQQAP